MTINTSSTYDRQSMQFMNETVPIEGASQELVDVLQKIVQNTGALLDVNNCSVALLDHGGTTLVTLAALHKEGYKPRHTRFQKSEGVAGWVAEHREALIINDVSLDPRFKRLGRVPVGSMVCVPLMMNKESFIGTLTASSPAKDAFDARKLHVLTIFADQAVLAISNARQAEIAIAQANQLEMLLNLSQGITTRLEAESLYRTILVNVQRFVSSQRAVIYSYHERSQELHPVAEVAAFPEDSNCGEDACASAVKVGEVQGEIINIHSSGSLTAWAALHRHPMLRSPVGARFIAPTSHHLSSAGNDTAHLPPVGARFIAPTTERNMHQDEQSGQGTKGGPEESTAIAEMAAPLVSKDILYGVLTLQRPSAFTSEELRLVRNLSNMAAAALENVELFHRVRTDQEQWRAIWSASSDGIALVGRNTCFLEANPAFAHIFGIDPQQITGMECLELFGCDDLPGYDESPGRDKSGPYSHELCMIQRALQEQHPLPYIEVDLTIKGASRSIGLSITPVSLTDQPFCLVIARDMTAIRDLTRMKANFLSMITHELRSPINAINGYLDLALTGIAGELNAQQREFIQRARSGSEHLYALVEDLLLVSRADSGQLRLNRSILTLPELVANSVEEMELTAADSHISIHVAIPGDFPKVYADGVRLQQVLRNLISNAIRFTPTGGSVTIAASIVEAVPTTSDDEAQKVVVVEVRDTGSGIASEHQARIFERFYQITQGNSGRTGGQGLGLAIVKMIVELHGGQVTVESVPGQGSTFTFTLPWLLS